jgi:hypothetical protein
MSYTEFQNYGEVIAIFSGTKLVRDGKVEDITMKPLSTVDAAIAIKPLSSVDAAKFMANTYCLLRTTRELKVYRGYETPRKKKAHKGSFILEESDEQAKRMGRWWSLYRPTLLIESLGLPSDLRQGYREFNAIKMKWNRLDVVMECALVRGSIVYLGRTAGQSEAFREMTRQLPGGAFQIFVPDLKTISLQYVNSWEIQ